MAQKYRIYINQKVILLTESEPQKKEDFEKIDADVFDLKIIYTWVAAHQSQHFYVLCSDSRAFLKSVLKSVPVISAAGGLVKNEKDEYLLIYRNDRWDIPKGKVEKTEKIKEAAVREVEEECGIKISSLEKKICKTYHAYINRGEVVIKKTHWFQMTCTGLCKLKPQKEEGITEARWFKKNYIGTIASNTFPSIMDVLVKQELISDKPAPLSE